MNDAVLMDNCNSVMFRFFELCDPSKMEIDCYIYIVSGFLAHFWDNKEYILISNNFLERFSNLLSQIKNERKILPLLNYLIIKYFDYDMSYNTNFSGNDNTNNAIIYKRTIIWNLYEIFNQQLKTRTPEMRAVGSIVLKSLFYINFNK